MLTKEQLLAHIQELQCRYVKYFNKYMTSISYGGKPDFCCFENLQAVKNYIRILKKSYEEYHYDCKNVPVNSPCCTPCILIGGQITIDSVVVDGTIDPTSPYTGSILNFINSNTFTWYPILGDSSGTYSYNCEANVLTLDIGNVDPLVLILDFNCDVSKITGYTTIEDETGNVVPCIFNMSVTEPFKVDCSDTGCCSLTSLAGNTLEVFAGYQFYGPDQGYFPITTEIIKLEFLNDGTVNIYNDNVLQGNYSYTYNPVTGYLYIYDLGPDTPIAIYLQFTCSFDKIVSSFYFLAEGSNVGIFNYYLKLNNVPVNSSCSEGGECTPIYSYCLSNDNVQTIIDKSYAILSQYCNC